MRRVQLILAACALVALTVVATAGATTKPRENIVQTATTAGQFKTLTALLKTAGLSKALERKGPYTVFAPTDAAFAKVPKSTLNALGKDKAKLRAVLLYHVVKGKLTAAKVVKRHSVRTLNGQKVRITVRAGKVRVGGARVTATDIGASNGVIHVLDRVLIPR